MTRGRGVHALRLLQDKSDALSAQVARDVGAILEADASPAALVRSAHHAHVAMDAASRRVRHHGPPPACSAGCSSCCHVHVEATEGEVLAVAAHLARTRDTDGMAQLRERLERHVARVEPLSDDERWAARIPCALLDADGRCSVHPARPLRCRAFHSVDADACRDAFLVRADAEPRTLAALDRVHDAVEEGFERALATAGVSTAPVRLELGLLRALRALD